MGSILPHARDDDDGGGGGDDDGDNGNGNDDNGNDNDDDKALTTTGDILITDQLEGLERLADKLGEEMDKKNDLTALSALENDDAVPAEIAAMYATAATDKMEYSFLNAAGATRGRSDKIFGKASGADEFGAPKLAEGGGGHLATALWAPLGL